MSFAILLPREKARGLKGEMERRLAKNDIRSCISLLKNGAKRIENPRIRKEVLKRIERLPLEEIEREKDKIVKRALSLIKKGYPAPLAIDLAILLAIEKKKEVFPLYMATGIELHEGEVEVIEAESLEDFLYLLNFGAHKHKEFWHKLENVRIDWRKESVIIERILEALPGDVHAGGLNRFLKRVIEIEPRLIIHLREENLRKLRPEILWKVAKEDPKLALQIFERCNFPEMIPGFWTAMRVLVLRNLGKKLLKRVRGSITNREFREFLKFLVKKEPDMALFLLKGAIERIRFVHDWYGVGEILELFVRDRKKEKEVRKIMKEHFEELVFGFPPFPEVLVELGDKELEEKLFEIINNKKALESLLKNREFWKMVTKKGLEEVKRIWKILESPGQNFLYMLEYFGLEKPKEALKWIEELKHEEKNMPIIYALLSGVSMVNPKKAKEIVKKVGFYPYSQFFWSTISLISEVDPEFAFGVIKGNHRKGSSFIGMWIALSRVPDHEKEIIEIVKENIHLFLRYFLYTNLVWRFGKELAEIVKDETHTLFLNENFFSFLGVLCKEGYLKELVERNFDRWFFCPDFWDMMKEEEFLEIFKGLISRKLGKEFTNVEALTTMSGLVQPSFPVRSKKLRENLKRVVKLGNKLEISRIRVFAYVMSRMGIEIEDKVLELLERSPWMLDVVYRCKLLGKRIPTLRNEVEARAFLHWMERGLKWEEGIKIFEKAYRMGGSPLAFSLSLLATICEEPKVWEVADKLNYDPLLLMILGPSMALGKKLPRKIGFLELEDFIRKVKKTMRTSGANRLDWLEALFLVGTSIAGEDFLKRIGIERRVYTIDVVIGRGKKAEKVRHLVYRELANTLGEHVNSLKRKIKRIPKREDPIFVERLLDALHRIVEMGREEEEKLKEKISRATGDPLLPIIDFLGENWEKVRIESLKKAVMESRVNIRIEEMTPEEMMTISNRIGDCLRLADGEYAFLVPGLILCYGLVRYFKLSVGDVVIGKVRLIDGKVDVIELIRDDDLLKSLGIPKKGKGIVRKNVKKFMGSLKLKFFPPLRLSRFYSYSMILV